MSETSREVSPKAECLLRRCGAPQQRAKRCPDRGRDLGVPELSGQQRPVRPANPLKISGR